MVVSGDLREQLEVVGDGHTRRLVHGRQQPVVEAASIADAIAEWVEHERGDEHEVHLVQRCQRRVLRRLEDAVGALGAEHRGFVELVHAQLACFGVDAWQRHPSPGAKRLRDQRRGVRFAAHGDEGGDDLGLAPGGKLEHARDDRGRACDPRLRRQRAADRLHLTAQLFLELRSQARAIFQRLAPSPRSHAIGANGHSSPRSGEVMAARLRPARRSRPVRGVGRCARWRA